MNKVQGEGGWRRKGVGGKGKRSQMFVRDIVS